MPMLLGGCRFVGGNVVCRSLTCKGHMTRAVDGPGFCAATLARPHFAGALTTTHNRSAMAPTPHAEVSP